MIVCGVVSDELPDHEDDTAAAIVEGCARVGMLESDEAMRGLGRWGAASCDRAKASMVVQWCSGSFLSQSGESSSSQSGWSRSTPSRSPRRVSSCAV